MCYIGLHCLTSWTDDSGVTDATTFHSTHQRFNPLYCERHWASLLHKEATMIVTHR